MSFVFEQPRAFPGDTFAGGVASMEDIAAAARDQQLYVDNLTAAAGAMEKAIDDRNAEVFRDTGVKLDNPYRTKLRQALDDAAMQEQRRFSALQGGDLQAADPATTIRDGIAAWQRQVAEAAARIPDGNVGARLNRSIEADAIRVAQESDARLARLLASRPGLGKYAASLAGGFAGTLRDPLQLSLMTLGGGPGAGRTVASRLLSTAAKEAFINGASEAAMQPVVQAWRRAAGLDNGLDAALKNVGFAAAFGGLVGGGAGLLGELGARLTGRALDVAGGAAEADARVSEPVRRTLAGDIEAAGETLPKIREALPAEARGALDHGETLAHLDAVRPASASPLRHEASVVAAHRAAETASAPAFTVDADQVARIVGEIAGDAPAAPGARAQSLVAFLKAKGGLLDHAGELKAIGAEKLAQKPRGADTRLPLDAAREAAEEAGYIGRAGEAQVTTVADLLDAIDREQRGQPVYSRQDAGAPEIGHAEAARAGLERTVAEIAGHAGPGVDDGIIRRAAELSIGEHLDPFDALEHVLTHADDAGVVPARAAHSGEPLPGWTDAELEAAGAARGQEPEPGFFPEPAKYDPELAISPADIEAFGDLTLPGEDGRPMSIDAYMADIEAGEELAAIVKACRA